MLDREQPLVGRLRHGEATRNVSPLRLLDLAPKRSRLFLGRESLDGTLPNPILHVTKIDYKRLARFTLSGSPNTFPNRHGRVPPSGLSCRVSGYVSTPALNQP